MKRYIKPATEIVATDLQTGINDVFNQSSDKEEHTKSNDNWEPEQDADLDW
ncbi:MAG: hypothetical protein LUI08_01755 [Prevotella sp.]|nr:hypothetical protein [Prevotella sp.]